MKILRSTYSLSLMVRVLLVSSSMDHGYGADEINDDTTTIRSSNSKGEDDDSTIITGTIRHRTSHADNEVDPLIFQEQQQQENNPRSLAEWKKLVHHHHVDKGDQNVPVMTRSLLNRLYKEESLSSSWMNHQDQRDLGSRRHTTIGNHHNLHDGPITAASRRRQSCQTGDVRKIVQCQDTMTEAHCKQELLNRGIPIVSDLMKDTLYFAICLSPQQVNDETSYLEWTMLKDLLVTIQDDPPRTLSILDEYGLNTSPGILSRSSWQQTREQIIPYGVNHINAPTFWKQYGVRGHGITVCIVDTGIMPEHEDFNGGDFTGSTNDGFFGPWDEDGHSHGTHVAGTVAAQDNTYGVVGVAPEASVHVIRVFNDLGRFTASDMINAFHACVYDGGADIISLSFGGPMENTAERDAIRSLQNETDVLFVAASGNTAERWNYVEYPAAYDEVLSVGAVDHFLHMANFSTHNMGLDIAAPGVNILSTSSTATTGYSEMSGTSMATPHVAGVAALLWSQFPDRPMEEIRTAMEESARDLGACGFDRLFGHGMMDVMAAAEYLETGTVAPDMVGCIDVQVRLRTDIWGSEISYRVTPPDDETNILYRGGPYANGRITTDHDHFQLPIGCYTLLLLDSYGDGWNNADYGQGEINLFYNGTEQVKFQDFEGAREAFTFGNCGEDGTVQVPSPSPTMFVNDRVTLVPETISPSTIFDTNVTCGDGVLDDLDECDDDNAMEDLCDDGESLLELLFQMDQWTRSENYMYLYDDDAPDYEWIWKVDRYQFENDGEYTGMACLDVSMNCYKFFFFDFWGDGLLSDGSLTLTLNGTIALEILPGDTGTLVEQGNVTSYWMESFGLCTEEIISANTTNDGKE